jgi:hypothetical protein
MRLVLVDTDVLIEVMREREPAIPEAWARAIAEGHRLLCSPVSIAEVWHGARPAEHERIKAVFSALHCIPAGEAIGRQGGDFLRTFSKSRGLDLGDALMAAAAAVHDLELWTRNRRRYPMRGLKFYDER